MELNKIYQGDALAVLKTFPENSVNCCVTSPPYYNLRDYEIEGQIGLESTPDEYVRKIIQVFHEVRRVLRKDGTLWLNLSDSYASNWPSNRRNRVGQESLENGKRRSRPPRMGLGLKEKDLIGIPWRIAFALQAEGWYLRSDIIWAKPNHMPEGVKDRPTKSHEYIFLMSKSPKYYYDSKTIEERSKYAGDNRGDRHDERRGTNMNSVSGKTGEGRNKRSVWTINTAPFKEAHFAVFPPKLIESCILAGCPKDGVVLDPFAGAGTTLMVAQKFKRNYVGIELNPEYIKIAEKRLLQPSML